MPQEERQQKKQISSKPSQKDSKINLEELAKKIVALLLQEIEIETERTGR